jgi:DNA-binding NarL/FixJ family response regulator
MAAVREALRWVLEDDSSLEVIGEATGGIEALRRAAQLTPDIVILDIELPDLDGLSVARSLKASDRPPLVVFLSVHDDPDTIDQSLAAGGDAFVPKSEGWPALVSAIRRVLDDHTAGTS